MGEVVATVWRGGAHRGMGTEREVAVVTMAGPEGVGDGAVVRWAELAAPVGTLRLYGSERGLLTVVLPGGSPEEAEVWVGRALGGATFVEDEGGAALREALAQFAEFFAGARRRFDLSLDLWGTSFQLAVWRAVAAIPYGETRSYGEIARAIGRPAAVRAVGAANGANRLPPVIPCHRVVGARGALTGYAGGLDMKRRLLALERGGASDCAG